MSTVAALNSPVVDRSVCEKLFGFRPPRARDLMRRFTGYECGNTVIINRRALIDALRRIAQSPDATAERARQEPLLSAELEKMHCYRAAARVQIPVPADVHDTTIADLAAGVKLEPGRLTIEFDSPLSKLYDLSQAAGSRVIVGNKMPALDWMRQTQKFPASLVPVPACLGRVRLYVKVALS